MYLFETQNFTFTTFCNNNKTDTMIRELESMPSSFFVWGDLRSSLGMIYGRGSFVVHFGDHLRSKDHLPYCTKLFPKRTN